jgi:hypothetical protein
MPTYRAGPVVYLACVTGCVSQLPSGSRSGCRHSSRDHASLAVISRRFLAAGSRYGPVAAVWIVSRKRLPRFAQPPGIKHEIGPHRACLAQLTGPGADECRVVADATSEGNRRGERISTSDLRAAGARPCRAGSPGRPGDRRGRRSQS